jgi:hypothetical protein
VTTPGSTTTRVPTAGPFAHPVHTRDDARNVRATHMWLGQFLESRAAASHPEVDMVKRTRLDLHEHLSRSGRGIGQIAVLHDFGAAVLLEE